MSISLTVEGENGIRARCIGNAHASQKCGICTKGQVGAWLGCVCTVCQAIVVRAETETREEAVGVEHWISAGYDRVSKELEKAGYVSPAAQSIHDLAGGPSKEPLPTNVHRVNFAKKR